MTVEDINIDKEGLCYLGNSKLKRANVKIPYTQEQVDEFIRCQQDPIYFIRNYINIVSLDHGLQKFSMYDYQETMVKTFKSNRFCINLLARQMGKTTTVGAYLLWEAIFTKNLRIAVLANKGDTAREILSRMKSMFEDLPWFLKPGVREWNKGSIEFSNGTKIISAATSNSSIRGQSMNIIYLDELAFIQNDTEFFASTYPVISAGETTKVIITSTPNGMNLFYKLWTESKSGKNSFVNLEFLWHHHPRRGEAWKNETLRNISQKQFDQEFNCIFMGSSDTLISGHKLQQLTFVDPIEMDDDHTLMVYKKPEEGHSYAITVDVGEGIGKDYSIISVFDITQAPYQHVAVYRNNIIPPLMLSDPVHRLAKQYNEAYVVVESNSIGKITADTLYYDYEYENMLTGSVKDQENVVGSAHIGVRTTRKTKAIGCSSLKTMIESDTLQTLDFATVSELTTFVKKGTSFEAEENKTDDIVMSLVIFSWFAAQPYFEDVTNVNMRDTIKANFARLDDQQHTVFGFYDDGTAGADEGTASLFQ